ncbi:MAG: thioredoxin family protein [Planctomycetes bacterium]|nr:thioredoxin family protein [Planctomycetota bacterium]
MTYDEARISIERMLEVVRAKGFIATLEQPLAPKARRRLDEGQRAKLDVETITHGEAVEITEHLVAGKFTLIDVYADWCGPCLLLGHELERLLLEREDVALRKLDIVSWETPAAKQVTAEFGAEGIPYVRVYGPKGEFLGAVSGNRIEEVRALIGD